MKTTVKKPGRPFRRDAVWRARAFSTPMDMARFGQMLLNRGGYGGYHFFSPETFEAMMPRPLSETAR